MIFTGAVKINCKRATSTDAKDVISVQLFPRGAITATRNHIMTPYAQDYQSGWSYPDATPHENRSQIHLSSDASYKALLG